MDRYKILQKPLPSCELLRTSTTSMEYYKTSTTRYILYSMADISKQVSEG